MRHSRIAFSFRPGSLPTDILPAGSHPFGMSTIRMPIDIRLDNLPGTAHRAPDARRPDTSRAAPARAATPSTGFVPPGPPRRVIQADHPDRDNNPLDMRSGRTTRAFGAVGDDRGFAVFDAADAGFVAAMARFDAIGGTLDHIIAVWSPAADSNDTRGLQRDIPAAAGLSGEMRWDQLSPAQRRAFLVAYARREGYHGAGPA